MVRLASVQGVHVDLQAVEDGVICLAGGQYRAVLEVSSLNFALQGEVEQEAIVAGFAAFLNGLSFPVQILVRVLPIDVEGYLRELENRALDLPEGLADLARDHAAYVRRLASRRTLLERRFYLMVPAQSDRPQALPVWPFGRRAAPDDAGPARRQLTFRCEEVRRQLGRCGLSARRFDSTEIAQLLYACWCPELSRRQRVRRDLDEYASVVVSGSPPGDVGQEPGREQRHGLDVRHPQRRQP